MAKIWIFQVGYPEFSFVENFTFVESSIHTWEEIVFLKEQRVFGKIAWKFFSQRDNLNDLWNL